MRESKEKKLSSLSAFASVHMSKIIIFLDIRKKGSKVEENAEKNKLSWYRRNWENQRKKMSRHATWTDSYLKFGLS